jgi:hypothetical protein
LVAVGIFRVGDGKVAEPWDVLQEHVLAADTAQRRQRHVHEALTRKSRTSKAHRGAESIKIVL